MQAIILAAGMGKRLKELTANNTKCMVEVNGETLIKRMLGQLERLKLDRVVIVTGYKGEELKAYIDTLECTIPIVYVTNEIYDRTNNIYSLYLARDYLLENDTLLLESDIIFEDSVLDILLEDKRDTLALVDKFESWMDGTCLKLDDEDAIIDVIPGKKFRFEDRKDYYKTVNIYKFSRHFASTHYIPFLEAYCHALGNNEYYEQVLRVITVLDEPVIKAKRLTGQAWYEIDDIQDLNIAESIFAPEDKKVELLAERYGGYWRYPKLVDFCYLVNPYYPSKRMVDELQANFKMLLTQYPSGMKVNSLLAAKNFNVHQENILVGNGAAELIKELLSRLDGKVGVIRPTFEEYPNRLPENRIVCYDAASERFHYTAEDVISYFDTKDVQCVVLINPDNPSGNYIDKQGLWKLLEWSKQRQIQLIVDESFVDFAEEPVSLFNQDILDRHPHLYVMKSLSKSHGVPGLRLGVLASGNTELIQALKKSMAIWNINSFAEFYMQIMEKYKADYQAALSRHCQERAWLSEALSAIPGIDVIPSQANYIMLRLTDGINADALTQQLLVHYNLLIKDLSKKLKEGQYVRIAVKTHEENVRLVEGMKCCLCRDSR